MNIGILGLGSIGMRHGENLRALGHRVIGYDTARERMSTFNDDCAHAERKGLLIWADAIVVATPSDQHLSDLASALSYRKPVLVEKPIATGDIEAVEKLVALAERDRIPVFVGYNLRCHPCVVAAREWLRAGRIGSILFGVFVLAQRNRGYKDEVVVNWSHEVDLALHLLGPVTSMAATRDQDTAAFATVHASGARAAIHLNYITQPQARFFTVVGTEGAIYVDPVTGVASCCGEEDSDVVNYGGFDASYRGEMAAFTAALKGEATELATGRAGLDALRVCLGALRQ